MHWQRSPIYILCMHCILWIHFFSLPPSPSVLYQFLFPSVLFSVVFVFFFHCDSRVVPIVQCPRILSRHCKCVHRYVSWQHFWSSKKDTTEQHSQTLLDKIKSQANLLFCDVYLCSVLRFCLSHHKYVVHHGLQTDYYELKSTFKKCRKAVKRWRI